MSFTIVIVDFTPPLESLLMKLATVAIDGCVQSKPCAGRELLFEHRKE